MKHIKNPYNNIHIVGCGGVGSWLAFLLARVLPKMRPAPLLVLHDGDMVEEKNLDRQMFDEAAVGQHKAEALMFSLPLGDGMMDAVNTYFHDGTEVGLHDLLFCCCDNHPARRYVLDACDRSGATAIIAANETTSAEAYLYLPAWRGTPADPRTYYPEILSDDSDDPTHRVSCAALIQSDRPQLAMANYMAAGQAAYLFWFLLTEGPQLVGEDVALWPARHEMNLYRGRSYKVSDLVAATTTTTTENTERKDDGNNDDAVPASAGAGAA